MEAAKHAGLQYTSDASPGISRTLIDGKFQYLDPKGREITDNDELIRMKRLAIPPAWTDVWICPFEDGHLQATGRDARGRKQYRYHRDWRNIRDENKYSRLMTFGHALPQIRQQVARDLQLEGLPKRKVLATVVRLLETTLIRIGNEEYARTNQSYGLTTMRDNHVRVEECRIEFRFTGKSGIFHEIDLEDCHLADVVKQCKEVPGFELFKYTGKDGKHHAITSTDVNQYLHEISGGFDFTAKDFRTWAATVLAAIVLQETKKYDTQRHAKRNIKQAIERVAQKLGNTPTICRKCYVHPSIIDAYLDGSLARALQRRVARQIDETSGSVEPAEAALMRLLNRRLKREAKERTQPQPSLGDQLKSSLEQAKKVKTKSSKRQQLSATRA